MSRWVAVATGLAGQDRDEYLGRVGLAESQISEWESRRASGLGPEDEDDEDSDNTEVSENEDSEETAEMYSSLSHDDELDGESDDENSEED